MEVIPAIDFKDGKVVNLKQGRLDESIVYSDDPVAIADRWVEAGAERLHLVDLDGAFEGVLVVGVPLAPVQIGDPALLLGVGHDDDAPPLPVPA